MKRSTYNFINQYWLYFRKKESSKITIEEILCSSDNSAFAEISKLLKIIQEEDVDVFENILAWDNEDILFDYLQIIRRYIVRKKAMKISIAEISRQPEIPVSTIKRIEGLHNMPSFKILLKILKTVGLKINIIN